ncbi:MAG: hypothetical protein IID34_11685 [Planctomycetes bacterium]|nr:hypothetical protein [Planctomycetota bacterium]
MATLIAEPAEVKTLTASDIIDPGRHYSATEIEELLDIPREVFLRAIRTMNYGYQGDIDMHGGVSGVDILLCIAKHDLKHRATTLARETWARKHRPPAVETPEPEPKDLASRVVRQIGDSEKSERAAEDDRRRNAWDGLLLAIYQAIGEGKDEVAQLARRHLPKGHTTASDADVLNCADAMFDLKIDAKKFRDLVEIMRSSLTQVLLHRDVSSMHKAQIDAREACKKFEKDTAVMEHELFQAKVRANNCYRNAAGAAYKLTMLRRSAPEFFDGDTPRKLGG